MTTKNGIMVIVLAGAAAFPAACTRVDEGENGALAGDSAAAGSVADSTAADAGGEAVLTFEGFGSVRHGMPVSAIGPVERPFPADSLSDCGWVRPTGFPEGVLAMVVAGVVERIDVRSGGIPTDRGIETGDDTTRVRSAYGEVESRPHKYTDGRYLIVTPADTMLRMVFETDADTVIRFRSGRMPQVLWVEGCS